MAWDDDKVIGGQILSDDWDAMVADQKSHAAAHESGGRDAITFGNLANVEVTQILVDTAANLPAAGTSGRVFFETDTGRTLYDNGTSWLEMGLSESQISLANLGSKDATSLDGSAGTNGQFLQTDGTNVTFSDVSTGTVTTLRSLQNTQQAAIARLQFIHNLEELGYQGGILDIFKDTFKVQRIAETWESGTFSGVQDWIESDTVGTTQIQSTTVKEGSNAVQITTTTNESFDYIGRRAEAEFPLDDHTYSVWVRFDDLSEMKIFYIADNGGSFPTNFVTSGVLGQFDDTGADFRTYDNGSQLASSNIHSPSTGAWYKYEFSFNKADSEVTITAYDSAETQVGSTTIPYDGAASYPTIGFTNGDSSTTETNYYVDTIEGAGLPSNLRFETLDSGDADGKVTLKPDASGWGVANSEKDGKTFDYSGQTVDASNATFNDDGTLMVMVDDTGNTQSTNLIEYSLSTAYDISTASATGNTFDAGTNAGSARDVEFGDNGTKMYLTSFFDDRIAEYNLSTAYDITTASHVNNLDISTNTGSVQDISFKDDGTKMLLGGSNEMAYEYSLSTAWDTTTASFVQSFDVNAALSGTTIDMSGISVKPDGTRMIAYGFNNMYEFDLSTAWDISTASYNGNSFDYGLNSNVRAVFFKTVDGKKFYVNDGNNTQWVQYSALGAYASSGSFETVTKDLSASENGGFTNPPSSWVVSQEAAVPSAADLQYVLHDTNGNTVTATQSDVDTAVDTSSLTSTTVSIEVQESTTDTAVTPELDDHMHHFQEG